MQTLAIKKKPNLFSSISLVMLSFFAVQRLNQAPNTLAENELSKAMESKFFFYSQIQSQWLNASSLCNLPSTLTESMGATSGQTQG